MIGLNLTLLFGVQAFTAERTTSKKLSTVNLTEPLKVINYNVWHGLTLDGLKTPSIESEGNKEKRVKHQISMLKAADADIIFMQEVNPVAAKLFKRSLTKRYAQALNMEYINRIDNCGIKIGGWGFPSIYSGLVIMAKPKFGIKKVKGKKLGTFFSSGFCNKFLSVQWKESRYAFVGTIQVNGESIYLVNTHLHHSFNAEVALSYLDKVKKELNEDLYQRIEKQIIAGEARRVEESVLLVKMINKIKSKDEKAEFILAGDFNDTPDSRTISNINNLNFVSVNNKNSDFFTWNPQINNAKQNRSFVFPYDTKGATSEENEALRNSFAASDNRQREIDYIFLSPMLSSRVQVNNTKLFGTESLPGSESHASDHFGVYTELSF